MELLGEGRASEILALDERRVLRRFKAGGDPEHEAAAMERAREHGYPVPCVYEVRADALVLERIDGRTMKEDGLREPAKLAEYARMLAELHNRLHEIPGLEHDVLLHLDLHPDNVLLSARGPVVIDWANAQDGQAELDPALTWVIMMTSAGPVGRRFAAAFAEHIDVRTALEEAAERRLRDRNVTPAEQAAVRRLLARQYD